jgi:hypothetical protein
MGLSYAVEKLALVLNVVAARAAHDCIDIAVFPDKKWQHSVKGRVMGREPLDFVKHMVLLGEGLFKRLYRVDKSYFHRMVALLSTDLARTQQRRDNIASAVDPNVMVAVILRFLAGARVLDLGWP